MIWVITRLAWSEKCVLQLADCSWLRQSALRGLGWADAEAENGPEMRVSPCRFQMGRPL